MPSTDRVSRRQTLALLGSGLLAGCLNETGSDTTDTPTAQNQGDPTPLSSEPTSATPTDTEPEATTPADQSAPDPTFEPGDATWAPPAVPADGTWPLPRYDAGGTRGAPRGTGPTSFPVNRLWDQTFSRSNVGVPIADGDSLFVTIAEADGSGTTIARLAPGSGEVVWNTETKQNVASGPALDGTDLYVALGSNTVAAYATCDGTRRTLTVPTARHDREMLVSGTIVYVTDEQDDLSAFDATSGKRSFRFDSGAIDVDAPVAGDVQTWTAQSIAVDGEHVYLATAADYNDQLPPDLGTVFALDPAAEEIAWSNRLAPNNPTDPTPAKKVAVRDGTVYVASEQTVCALNASDGSRKWASNDLADYLWARLAVTPSTVYAVTPAAVVALDAATGEKQWTIDAPMPVGVAAAGNTLFLASTPPDEQTTLLVVGEDGTELWRHEFDGQIRSLMPAHDRLYAGTNDGHVLAFA
jgi:outer membrane protein assembly factor BamB